MRFRDRSPVFPHSVHFAIDKHRDVGLVLDHSDMIPQILLQRHLAQHALAIGIILRQQADTPICVRQQHPHGIFLAQQNRWAFEVRINVDPHFHRKHIARHLKLGVNFQKGFLGQMQRFHQMLLFCILLQTTTTTTTTSRRTPPGSTPRGFEPRAQLQTRQSQLHRDGGVPVLGTGQGKVRLGLRAALGHAQAMSVHVADIVQRLSTILAGNLGTLRRPWGSSAAGPSDRSSRRPPEPDAP